MMKVFELIVRDEVFVVIAMLSVVACVYFSFAFLVYFFCMNEKSYKERSDVKSELR